MVYAEEWYIPRQLVHRLVPCWMLQEWRFSSRCYSLFFFSFSTLLFVRFSRLPSHPARRIWVRLSENRQSLRGSEKGAFPRGPPQHILFRRYQHYTTVFHTRGHERIRSHIKCMQIWENSLKFVARAIFTFPSAIAYTCSSKTPPPPPGRIHTRTAITASEVCKCVTLHMCNSSRVAKCHLRRKAEINFKNLFRGCTLNGKT